jgi:hypothetical protein
MAFVDDLVTLLTAAGVGTFATDLFVSSQAVVPKDRASLTIIETGGLAPERTHNSVSVPAYQRPGAQLLARAPTYAAASAKARAAYNALVGVRNLVVSGGAYFREINPNQEPFDLGPDPAGLAQAGFNVWAVKRPS